MQKDWLYEPVISYYESLLFYNALFQYKDNFYYSPIAIAKREETGTKYRFLCIAKPKTYPGACSHLTTIEIYKPANGMPYTTKLSRIPFPQL